MTESTQLPLIPEASHTGDFADRRRKVPRKRKPRPVRALGLQLVQIQGVTAGTLEPGDSTETHPFGAGTKAMVTPDRAIATPCTSGPGLCMVLTCRLNLIGEVENGTLQVSRHKKKSFRLPVKRNGKGVLRAGDIDEAATLVAERAEQLMLRWGTTCARDVRPQNFYDLASLIGGTRQRAQQIEATALRRMKLECERRGIEWTGPTRRERTYPEGA